jgi:hypothetical protein
MGVAPLDVLHTSCEQHPDRLFGDTSGLGVQFVIGECRQRVRHIDDGIIRHTPDGSRRLCGGHEMIGADGRGWNASAVEMDAVVHTARAAGASISHPDDHQIAGLGEFIDDPRIGRFRGRGFAAAHDLGEPILVV